MKYIYNKLLSISLALCTYFARKCKRHNEEEVVEEKPEKKLDISEPVISFIETYKNNPKRFKLTKYASENKYIYYLHDKTTGTTFSISENFYTIRGLYEDDLHKWHTSGLNTDFLTSDEIDYIFTAIQEIVTNRKVMLLEKKHERQRNRYIKDYCKEN